MAKGVAAYRLQLASYPLQISIDTQYSDMDVNGHINNIALARFYEAARARAHLLMFDNPRFFKNPEYATLLAEYLIKFLREGHYPEPMMVGVGLGRIGNTSYTFEQALFQNGECIGICDVAMVLSQNGKPCPIPEAVRARVQPLLMSSR
jgi:acyl-CoA thioester hydrolase